MLTVILAAATVVCAAGWLNRYVTTMAMIAYFLKKGCPAPTEAEMRECVEAAWKQLFKRSEH